MKNSRKTNPDLFAFAKELVDRKLHFLQDEFSFKISEIISAVPNDVCSRLKTSP